jgi:hypothetical protein
LIIFSWSYPFYLTKCPSKVENPLINVLPPSSSTYVTLKSAIDKNIISTITSHCDPTSPSQQVVLTLFSEKS